MINRKVFIVAGHDIDGDPGATYGQFREAQETVQISNKLVEILKQYPIDIIVDPYTNDMFESVNFVNARCAGIDDGVVIDIHKNSFSAPAYGLETWIMRDSDNETIALGTAIQEESINTTNLVNRGVKNENWYVITNAKCRGALVECGFINADPNSDDYDYKYALGIARGLLRFFGIPFELSKPVVVPEPKKDLVAIDIVNKLVITNKETSLWDLGFSSFVNAKSIKVFPKGTVLEVSALVDHPLGGRYYLTEYSFSKGIMNGINIADVANYTAPVVVTPVPEPTPVEPEVPVVVEPTPEPETPPIDVPVEPVPVDNTPRTFTEFLKAGLTIILAQKDKIVALIKAIIAKLK